MQCLKVRGNRFQELMTPSWQNQWDLKVGYHVPFLPSPPSPSFFSSSSKSLIVSSGPTNQSKVEPSFGNLGSGSWPLRMMLQYGAAKGPLCKGMVVRVKEMSSLRPWSPVVIRWWEELISDRSFQ